MEYATNEVWTFAIVRFIQIRNKKLALQWLRQRYLANFFWWCRFYKVKFTETSKRCTYRSINILVIFEISQGNVYCVDLSGEYLLWVFSLNNVSNFIWEEAFRKLLFGWFLNCFRSMVPKCFGNLKSVVSTCFMLLLLLLFLLLLIFVC